MEGHCFFITITLKSNLTYLYLYLKVKYKPFMNSTSHFFYFSLLLFHKPRRDVSLFPRINHFGRKKKESSDLKKKISKIYFKSKVHFCNVPSNFSLFFFFWFFTWHVSSFPKKKTLSTEKKKRERKIWSKKNLKIKLNRSEQ